MDYAALPPEVNSGWMYAGPGSGPMRVTASAWDKLAAELSSAASAYQSVVSELSGGPWLGPASEAMAAAATPYVAWMHTTATQAAQTAGQARAAAAAYEAAFAATVPPPVIAANRALLTSLVTTNVLGQNSPAIAATQAHYGEMWAQDAAAMHGYAASSAAATQLAPFSAAAQETNPAAPATQASAVAQATGTGGFSQLLSQLSQLPIDFLTSPLGTNLGNFEGLTGLPITFATGPMFAASGIEYQVAPLMFAALSFAPYAATAAAHGMPAGVLAGAGAAEMPAGALGSTLAGSGSVLAGSGVSGSGLAGAGGAGTSAGLGRAVSVGGLSVPQSWGTAAPEIRLGSAALSASGMAGVPQVGMAAPGMAGLGGMPVVGSVVNAPRKDEGAARSKSRSKVMAGLPGEFGGSDDMPARPVSAIASPLSERERDELEQLREEIAELAMEHAAVARLMGEAMRP